MDDAVVLIDFAYVRYKPPESKNHGKHFCYHIAGEAEILYSART